MGYLTELRRLVGSRKLIHPAARILLQNREGSFLLIRRADTHQWGLVAGGLEAEEDIRSCIIREVREETGLELLGLQMIGLSSNPAVESVIYPNGDEVQYFTVVFYSNHWQGTLLKKSEEAREIRFFRPEDLPNLPPNEAPAFQWLKQFQETGEFIVE